MDNKQAEILNKLFDLNEKYIEYFSWKDIKEYDKLKNEFINICVETINKEK